MRVLVCVLVSMCMLMPGRAWGWDRGDFDLIKYAGETVASYVVSGTETGIKGAAQVATKSGITKWGVFGMRAAKAANVVGLLTITAAALGAFETDWQAWFASQGFTVNGGVVYKPGTGGTWEPAGDMVKGTTTSTLNDGSHQYNYIGIYQTQVQLDAAIQAAMGSYANTPLTVSMTTLGLTGWAGSIRFRCGINWSNPARPLPIPWGVCSTNGGANVVWVPAGAVPATAGDVETKLLEDLLAGQADAAAATVAAIKWAAEEVVKAMQGLSSLLPSGTVQAIADAIKEALPDGVFDELFGQDNPEGYIADQEDTTLTQDQIKTAVKEAISESGGDGWDPPDALTAEEEPAEPEKSNLTTVLETYLSAFSGLPFLTWISDWQVTIASTDSVLSLPKPQMMGGGYVTIDFRDYESHIEFLGQGDRKSVV